MFDMGTFEAPSASAPEMAPLKKDGGPGIKIEQLKEITDFFAGVLKEEIATNEKSELLSLMAEAGQDPDDTHVWEMMTDELRGAPGIGDFTAIQLQKAMRGSPLLKKAIELMQDAEPGEDVNVKGL